MRSNAKELPRRKPADGARHSVETSPSARFTRGRSFTQSSRLIGERQIRDSGRARQLSNPDVFEPNP